MIIYKLSVKDVAAKFRVNPETGLTNREIKKRLAKYGHNAIQLPEVSIWYRLAQPFMDIFMVMLGAALLLCLIQQEWIDAIVIGAIIAIDAIIFYIQQFSTDRILRSLKRTTISQIRVLRNGDETEIDTKDLVPGDIVILTEGSRIPADGRILEESGLLTNEAMLTGESDPVHKDAKKLNGNRKVYEQKNMVFSGSFVVTGNARMIVVATGNDTEYGRIASLASSVEYSSPIQQKINKLVIKIAIGVSIIAVVILILSLMQGIPFVDSLQVTIAMLVSAVPESLPVAIAIVLALGARNMAKRKALIKEMRAIESIGVITCVATDKTGTLTENRLSIQETWALRDTTDLNHFLKQAGLPDSLTNDPLDHAIHDFVGVTGHAVRSYAFDQDIKMSGNLFAHNVLVVKGSPEVLINRSRLSKAAIERVDYAVKEIAEKGLKPIAIAEAVIDKEINELHRLDKGQKFSFLGLIGVADTLRPGTIPAIAEARTAGVTVKMITGDHAATAFAIGKKLGLADNRNQVFDCSKLSNITDEHLEEVVGHATIFARVTPEDKFRILTAIKRRDITAMTGDGVNDVPALMNAHIGIAMGDSPSIVQDAGDVILLDNNLRSIVEAIKEGRIVLSNIRRMLVYVLATNAGEVITMTAALLITGSHLLHPIQILWVNLVTDSLLVIPLGLEPPEKPLINTKPEHKDAPILSGMQITRMTIIALTMAIVTTLVYIYSINHYSHEQSITLAFTALVVMQWSSAIVVRGEREYFWQRIKVISGKFWVAFFVAVLLQVFALATPLGQQILHTVNTPPEALLWTSVAAFLAPIITVELHKLWVNCTSME